MKFPEFAAEIRNVRLGLASDGFNPFGTMSISHSSWPVILMPYNLPPWLCMKQSYFILSLIIPGPKAPGNDIDVYLEPLIDELCHLWKNGVKTYDASLKEEFVLCAALLWTINDFPAYGNLSGWSTKGKLACPSCHKDTTSKRLRHGKKDCYMRHRRFLPLDHPYRRDRKNFDGTQERGESPTLLTGPEVMDQLSGFPNVTFGKIPEEEEMENVKGRKQKRKCNDSVQLPFGWKKLVFFSVCLIGHPCC